ncbi:PadR family transcriptional regulator [Aneurinibacillus aneurinilyticus]|uniref:PadR family transcriptional regulator n=1 Tax=Aneurinibacillus aneurinilyticus TaxID=1391 RepID=UPI002E1F2D71|nr:PadR family transcriptional regulator [Aneurinibacillus aneurinilyticus]
MSSTRLLILGFLIKHQPIHGYDVRKELEAWRVDQWANIAYGSIYFALNKMASEGLIKTARSQENEAKKKGPSRIVYTVTDKGEREFKRLLQTALWDCKPGFDSFLIAIMFMNHLPQDQLLGALKHRADVIHAKLEGINSTIEFNLLPPGSARFVGENLKLIAAQLEAEHRWIETMIDKIKQGMLP